MAKIIDKMTYLYLEAIVKRNEVFCEHDLTNIYTARSIRDFFNSIETK